MSRPTRVFIDTQALMHNVAKVKQYASGKKIIAMVKANAYGCGLASVLPVLEQQVDAFGVACLEEALVLRELGIQTSCVLFQGIFSANELPLVVQYDLECVIHHWQQLHWILAMPLTKKIKVWLKVDTGMHRLGFMPQEVPQVVEALLACQWIDAEVGLMTHLACADEPQLACNQVQLEKFNTLHLPKIKFSRSIANSAAIIALPEMHFDVVRPGIMLYGVSPFAQQTGIELGLKPVMHFMSAITAIHHYPAYARIGYGGVWHSNMPSIIGVVAAGYGDGYPRGVAPGTCVWVNEQRLPIVGRVSMDMLMIDLTHSHNVQIGQSVELWGPNIPVEEIAQAVGTIGYELICHLSPRVHRNSLGTVNHLL